jgi:phage baseplate assembly protein W
VSYPDLPHFGFPFTRTPDGTSVAVNEQDTVEDVMACEMVIVSYPAGFREDRPEFGWAFPDLEQAPLSTAALELALKNFEPRAPVEIDQVYDYALATATFNVNVQIRSDAEEPSP